jgi:hypothetical protein
MANIKTKKSFYDEMQGTLNSLISRVKAAPQSELIIKIIQEIQETIKDLREIHERQGEKGLTSVLTDISFLIDYPFFVIFG